MPHHPRHRLDAEEVIEAAVHSVAHAVMGKYGAACSEGARLRIESARLKGEVAELAGQLERVSKERDRSRSAAAGHERHVESLQRQVGVVKDWYAGLSKKVRRKHSNERVDAILTIIPF